MGHELYKSDRLKAFRGLIGPDGEQIKETPYEYLQRRLGENETAEGKIPVKVFLSQKAGSDPLVIAQIERCLEEQLPFGLKCDKSMIVYIPAKLGCYWIGHSAKSQQAIVFETFSRLVDSVKMQYLSHKEFISTQQLTKVALLMKYNREQKELE
jgi:hypothetical protein